MTVPSVTEGAGNQVGFFRNSPPEGGLTAFTHEAAFQFLSHGTAQADWLGPRTAPRIKLPIKILTCFSMRHGSKLLV